MLVLGILVGASAVVGLEVLVKVIKDKLTPVVVPVVVSPKV